MYAVFAIAYSGHLDTGRAAGGTRDILQAGVGPPLGEDPFGGSGKRAVLGGVPGKRRRFEREFDDGAVRIVRETSKPIAQVAADLGINSQDQKRTQKSPLTWDYTQNQRALLTVGTTGFEPATP
jgi:hypothetical protein